MSLPEESVAANTLPEVTTIPTGKKLIFTDPDTNEGGIITLENLSKQILQNLTSQTFALDQGNLTLLQALNQLNSNPFLRYSRTYGTSLIVENVRGATHGLILIDNSLITFYISGSASIGYKIITSQLPDGVTVNNTNKTMTIIIPDEGVITCFYAYIK